MNNFKYILFLFLFIFIYGALRDFLAMQNTNELIVFNKGIFDNFLLNIYIRQISTFAGLAHAITDYDNQNFFFLFKYLYFFVLTVFKNFIPLTSLKDLFFSLFNNESIYSATVIPSILEFAYLSMGAIGVFLTSGFYYFFSIKSDRFINKKISKGFCDQTILAVVASVAIVFTLRGSPWAGFTQALVSIFLGWIYLNLHKFILVFANLK